MFLGAIIVKGGFITNHVDLQDLQVVADARHVGSQLFPIGEPNHNTLPVGAVWLFGLLYYGSEDYTLGEGDVGSKRVWSWNSLTHMRA